ncbi:alpha-E domain-containing protein [Chitinophaga sp. SYP-B3965]|uniref:alpha-E domain-containing protein n=1 Tax=Chitinophaga sp. SYP-B3965 TaxID=2663120 RepID=UPI0012999896|nr:alpha-E domain-containing protein [Chitinophaga sp. SYP-B3965]MRG44648.1 alpha-E domain-containing protein [Chitinophaga sp. SYP-B3965]
MLSRIADSLYWLNRYMERADGLLRVVSTHYILSFDKDVNGNLTWRPVLEMFSITPEEEIAAIENDTGASLKKLITDTTNDNSLKMIMSRARENARGVQDHITKEVWEEVNSVYHLMNYSSLEGRLGSYEAIEVLGLFTRHSVMYAGVTDITMARGTGWHFMNLGKYIERCLEALVLISKQYALINYKLDEMRDIMQWRYLLMSLSGYELHLKTYGSSNYNYNVIHQILFNEEFPHSVIYSLARIERHLAEVIKQNNSVDNANLMRHLGRIHSKVRYTDMESLNDQTLPQFLEDIRGELVVFARRLAQNFFSYS